MKKQLAIKIFEMLAAAHGIIIDFSFCNYPQVN